MSGHQQAERDDWGQQFELATAQFYTAVVMAGDIAIDGGANAGMHTIPLAHLVGATGRVIACEPQPACLADLERRLTYEGLAERVVLCQGVLAAQSGTATFLAAPDR